MEPIQLNIKVTVEASKETATLITILADFAKKLAERSEKLEPTGAHVYTGGGPKPRKNEEAGEKPAAQPSRLEDPEAEGPSDDPFAGLEEPKAGAAKPEPAAEPEKAATHEGALRAVEDAKKRGIPKALILQTLRESFKANAAADLQGKDIPEFIRKMNSLKAPGKGTN